MRAERIRERFHEHEAVIITAIPVLAVAFLRSSRSARRTTFRLLFISICKYISCCACRIVHHCIVHHGEHLCSRVREVGRERTCIQQGSNSLASHHVKSSTT